MRSAVHCSEDRAQISNGRKDFLVPVGPLIVMRRLFHLDDRAILGKDAVGEPGQNRPSNIEDLRYFRPAHGKNDKGPVISLRFIDRRITEPNAEGGFPGRMSRI